jgi:ribosomal protein S18 acetylase RimI-like enzyme
MDSSTSDGMLLRVGTVGDAAVAADLHAEQINEGFLAFLGPRFLRKLYRRLTLAPDSFVLVVEDGGTVVGFLAGSTDVAGLYRAFVWRDGAGVALTCGGRLIRSWRRALETLRHGSGDVGAGAELLAVAVHPSARGKGVGGLLVEGFLTEILRRHEDAGHVVVAASNAAAIALYGRAGFQTAQRIEMHSGTQSLVMQWRAAPRTDR